MKKILLLLFYINLSAAASGQGYDIAGYVQVRNTGEPIGQAVVELPAHGLWAVTGDDGHFAL